MKVDTKTNIGLESYATLLSGGGTLKCISGGKEVNPLKRKNVSPSSVSNVEGSAQILAKLNQLQRQMDKIAKEESKPSAKRRMAPGYERKTYVVNSDYVERVKVAAFVQRGRLGRKVTEKEVVEEALKAWFDQNDIPDSFAAMGIMRIKDKS